ncbi:hypothetical protein IFR04_012958 [Cadophora malorum]|uniref:Hydrophobin n=1 Tax=Cadophora malorum TaxID=108018 RepID=A0A8H7W3L4_9HELO|nr:hypothetical protein IFR04_012958 [Cadophora malorum]
MMFFRIFSIAAAMLVTSSAASEFFCGINTKGGCCTQFFTNPFDQYASGVGCDFATAIIPSASTVGDTEWSCTGGLNQGCCSLDHHSKLIKVINIDHIIKDSKLNNKLNNKLLDEEMHVYDKMVEMDQTGQEHRSQSREQSLLCRIATLESG